MLHLIYTLAMPALLLAAQAPARDIYLDVDPELASRLAEHHGRMEIAPMLAAPLLEKLGRSSWHRARISGWQPSDSLWLKDRPEVRFWEAVPDYRTSSWVPDDPGMRAQWHIERIGAVQAWQVQQGDPAVSIAIVDTGVDYTHEDLAGKIWTNPGEDLDGDGLWTPADMNNADDDGNGYVDDGIGWDFVDIPNSGVWPGEDGSPADNDPLDFDGHGTHCAGDAAAAGFNGIGVVGPAARCSIMAIRAGYLASDGQGYVSHGLEGMLLALAYGADVVSMSFGGSGSSQFWIDASQQADGAGLIMLAAAGNDGSDQIHYPSGYAAILAVGATRSNDHKAGFSNYGDWVDLAAPGVNILSTAAGGGYANMGGTSMACPVAAGAAALLRSMHPDWRGADVLAALAPDALPMPGEGMGIGRIDIGATLARESSARSLGILGSGRLPETSSGTLQIVVSCGEEPIADGRLKVWGSHAELPLDTLELAFGFLPPFAVDTLALEIGYLGNEVQDLELNAEMQDLGMLWKGALRVPCGVTELLLLDGDSSDNWSVAGWYFQALEELGLRAERGRLVYEPVAELPWQRISQVLIFTGSDLDPVFDSQLEDSLAAFLDTGGKVILSGQRIAEALSPTFLEERVGVDLSNEGMPGVQVYGVAGEDLTEDLRLLLIGSGGAGNQSECQVLEPLDASALFSWEEAELDRLAAVKAPDDDLYLFTFGLEGINPDADWAADLATVLGRVLDAESAIEPRHLPQSARMLKAWPNPFNPVLGLSWSQPAAGALRVYDMLGRQVKEIRLEPGARDVLWQPEGLAAGVYVLELPLSQVGGGVESVRRTVTYLP